MLCTSKHLKYLQSNTILIRIKYSIIFYNIVMATLNFSAHGIKTSPAIWSLFLVQSSNYPCFKYPMVLWEVLSQLTVFQSQKLDLFFLMFLCLIFFFIQLPPPVHTTLNNSFPSLMFIPFRSLKIVVSAPTSVTAQPCYTYLALSIVSRKKDQGKHMLQKFWHTVLLLGFSAKG